MLKKIIALFIFLNMIGLVWAQDTLQKNAPTKVQVPSKAAPMTTGAASANPQTIPRCTGGQIWVNNKCECKPNFYWNESKNLCRPVRTCPPGQIFDRESDECVARCTGGQIWVNNKCECKPNFYWNESKNLCRPVRTCPPGQIFDRESDECVTR